jgi:hypothetical protein
MDSGFQVFRSTGDALIMKNKNIVNQKTRLMQFVQNSNIKVQIMGKHRTLVLFFSNMNSQV